MTFIPPRGLQNRHIQTIFSSVGPRRRRVHNAFAAYKSYSQEVLLECHDGIRLSGYYNRASEQASQQLVTLIHGWEGSADSSYMLSLSACLLQAGVDVFRLNLRDHGDSHHLNRGLFNSTLVPEVISGLTDLQSRFKYASHTLVGFSLGGNFALRVAAQATEQQLSLARVIAFCPVLHAARSNHVLNSRGNFIYRQYFVRKWKRSLRKKLQHYPEYDFAPALKRAKNLDDLNQFFIPRYTEFEDVDAYFDAYAVTGKALENTICPCYLHFAQDDMIIPWHDIDNLANNPALDITVTKHGGHCGFLSNWRLDSWQDERVIQLLQL